MPDWTQGIWGSEGTCQVFKVAIDNGLAESLHHDFESAQQAKQARLQTANAVTLLKSLEQRGIIIKNTLPVFDVDDVVGLLGEMLAKDVLAKRGYERVFVKFEATGTSKSRGVDLVVRRFDRAWELRLVEAKHLHQAVKGKTKKDTPTEVRARFSDGLDGFESESTIVNLALVVKRLIDDRSTSKGAGIETPELDDRITFLISKLRNVEYSLEIVTSIDSIYCDGNTLAAATDPMGKRNEIGTHEICLSLLETEGLESFTTEACKKYA